MSRWIEKKIIFVTGKGGVGKSLMSAAIAKSQAELGRRVLLAEVGESSYFKDFWSLPEVGHQPKRVPGQDYDLALWSGESCLREYVLHLLKFERLYQLFFENKVMRSLINVAPGLAEIAILGKITSGIRKVGPPLDYDLIVVDLFATGHALALLRAPKGMMEAVQFGPMGHHSREMLQVISDAKLCGYAVVTLPEELPVVESLELIEVLKREFHADVELVCNKVSRPPMSQDELINLRSENAPDQLKDFVEYLRGVQSRQSNVIQNLIEKLGAVRLVPMFFSSHPNELVELSSRALKGETDVS